MKYELTGKVKLVQDAQTFASGFTKQCLIVTVEDGKYPQDISLEFLKDNVALLDGVEENDTVKVWFNIQGREYNDRYFNNLVGWKIEVEGKEQVDQNDAAGGKAPLLGQEADDSDDLPF